MVDAEKARFNPHRHRQAQRRFSSTNFMRSAATPPRRVHVHRRTPHKVLFVMIHDGGQENESNSGISLSAGIDVFAVGPTQLPNLIVRAGDHAVRRFVEFFAATIRNRNTRAAYAEAIGQFCNWCEGKGCTLQAVSPVMVAAYIEQLSLNRSAPTVKQHLAAIRMLCDWLVTGHIIPINPAWSVRGPRLVVKKGKTPVLTAIEARQLLDSIDISNVIGLRDRADCVDVL